MVKKLAILVTYLMLFLIVASGLRPREVPRFAACCCSSSGRSPAGRDDRYRLRFNVFYALAELLPGFHATVPSDLYTADRSAA